MDKRILTEDEQLILNLYHASQRIEFYKFDESNNDAMLFAAMLAVPKFDEANKSKWYQATKRISDTELKAVGFVK